MKDGDYVSIKVQPYGGSNKKKLIVVKLLDEFFYTVDCITAQPKWWDSIVIYSETDLYKVDAKFKLCIPYIKELDYKIITEAEALAMAI